MDFSSLLQAAAKKAGFDDSFSTDLKLSEPKFGDWQLNGALAYAKAHGLNPREVAQKFVEALALDPAKIKVSIAGPGFVNFTFTPTALAEELSGLRNATDVTPPLFKGQKILLDYGSPNLGKELHIGHFRAYNIGIAVGNLLEACGATLRRDNHYSDWGTTFGYIIYALKKTGATLDANDAEVIAKLEALYKSANAEAKENPAVTEAARAETARLQSGDPENTALWKKIVSVNLAALKRFHQKFGARYDTLLGESFYNDKLERVYRELTELGLAKLDDGALVIFHPEHPRFKTQPFIIRKSDGAANYASTDLATMLYRVEVERAARIYIVTDARQADHFEQLWLTVQKWFTAKGYPLPVFAHISHGTIMGEDGRPLKTRSGENVKLRELLEEAVERAAKIVEEKNPSLSAAEKAHIAEVIGGDAIRYADLAQNRTSDYQFVWDRLLSFEGNTAPYLLYAIARIYSLFEKLGRSLNTDLGRIATLQTDSEIALARKLLQASHFIGLAAADLRPHYLCTYLYELAGVFSAFYNSDHIQGEPPEVQTRRLFLAQKALLVLETGMHLLGLETLKKM